MKRNILTIFLASPSDLQEERKLRENQSKFASIKRNLKLFGGDFEEIIQLQNSSLGKDSVRINLIDHWLAFLEKLNEFKGKKVSIYFKDGENDVVATKPKSASKNSLDFVSDGAILS